MKMMLLENVYVLQQKCFMETWSDCQSLLDNLPVVSYVQSQRCTATQLLRFVSELLPWSHSSGILWLLLSHRTWKLGS